MYIVKKLNMVILKCVCFLINQKVEHSHKRNYGFLSDFCDTEHFKNHPLFGVDPYMLYNLYFISMNLKFVTH